MAFAMRARSEKESTSQAVNKACFKQEPANAGSLSLARSKADTAERPIQCADPSSPIAKPHPPARRVCPPRLRPYANEPVPALTTTPGPVSKAASSAICISPTTSIGLARTSPNIWRTLPANSARPAPAPPIHVRSTCCGVMPAAAQACRTEACRDSVARAGPTLTMLLGPVVTVANNVVASPIAQVVLVPPPSMPR